MMSELFPIHLKYEIFAKMIEFDSGLDFDDVTVEDYINNIVKARNTLAHKKLDVCKTQESIIKMQKEPHLLKQDQISLTRQGYQREAVFCAGMKGFRYHIWIFMILGKAFEIRKNVKKICFLP